MQVKWEYIFNFNIFSVNSFWKITNSVKCIMVLQLELSDKIEIFSEFGLFIKFNLTHLQVFHNCSYLIRVNQQKPQNLKKTLSWFLTKNK